MAVFARVADSGSFSRAARELGLSQPSVSRIVGELETRLGVKLLLRTTRRVTPTDAGLAFLERAKQVMADLDEAEHVARGVDSLHGLIRIVMPVTFGLREAIPRLAPFMEAHPKLKLDINMSDLRQDLIAEGADVALRLGDLRDSSFGARKLATFDRIVVASRAYVERHGTPLTPADLAAHAVVLGPNLMARRHWLFSRESKTVSVELEARVQASTGEGMMACVRAGMGVGMTSAVMCRDEIAAGTVVRLLADYALPSVTAHAVFPGGPRPSAKVRALVEHLVRSFAERPVAEV
ncbi:MAG: LysR family transcriptional regulator [Caulobacter sp.]|nr:LysR family transcriptional regulator [Caulobacter sp.]